jgi:hypothetical protein
MRSGLRSGSLALVGLLVTALSSCSRQRPGLPEWGTPDWKIYNALHAGPRAIVRGARVMDWPKAGGAPQQLKAGSNGWTCFPDDPATPGPDPICMDSVFAVWTAAVAAHQPPAITAVGMAYRFQGGTYASLTDPFLKEPAHGQQWISTGPHLEVVLPNPGAFAGMSSNWKTGDPYVLWANTPYAHLIAPVGFAEER